MPSAQKGRKRKSRLPPYKLLVVSRGSGLRKIGAKALMDFINPFIEEHAYLSLQKKVTLKQEEKFIDESARALDAGSEARIYLFIGGKVAGNCSARQAAMQSDKGNVSFGLAVSKEFRGLGFGELLLRKGIALARKKFRPHKMWIDRDAKNRVAAGLYRKVGFRDAARLKEYHMHFGEYDDKVIMEYRGKK